jgi:hypothetical protein
MIRRCLRTAGFAGLVCAIYLFFAPTAQAYIDPGSSSFIIQILIGAAAGGALAIATFWRRIRAFFRRRRGAKTDEGVPAAPSSETAFVPPAAPPSVAPPAAPPAETESSPSE